METLGEGWTADGGQRALLMISTRRGPIARLSYSNSYPARCLLANKKRDMWRHVMVNRTPTVSIILVFPICNVTTLVPKWLCLLLICAPSQIGQQNYHSMLVPCHDTKPSSMIFMRVSDLQELKNQVPTEPWRPDIWISFPFLAWDLEIYPRTHMWFFNQLWCTGACACI